MQMQREWTPQEGKIPALSIAQPFTMAIIQGRKSIELREWQTHYRGLIALHAGKSWYGGIKTLQKCTEPEFRSIARIAERLGLPKEVASYPLGAIIGIARLVKCSRFSEEGWEKLRNQHRSDGMWRESIIGWQFADVQVLSEPIPTRGYLGLFGVELEPIMAQLAQLERKAE